MPVNSDKPHLWKQDIASSVDLYNEWFMRFAPEAYKETRAKTAEQVRQAMEWTQDLKDIRPDLLLVRPTVLPILRMATVPPIARDRLIGLAKINPNLVRTMELLGSIPPRLSQSSLQDQLGAAVSVLRRLLDTDILPWLEPERAPTEIERQRAATIVADRLCGAVADPIIRNAQEKRQLALIGEYLGRRGYRQVQTNERASFTKMPDKTFAFRLNAPVTVEDGRTINIPVDVVVQTARTDNAATNLPLLIEAKSAGDYTNVNKRRKEEAMKITQLKKTYGPEVRFILFLCGYFDSGYLGYEAAEGIDWVWEHRIDDLVQFGV